MADEAAERVAVAGSGDGMNVADYAVGNGARLGAIAEYWPNAASRGLTSIVPPSARSFDGFPPGRLVNATFSLTAPALDPSSSTRWQTPSC